METSLRINWQDASNILLLNPRWPLDVQNHFQNLFSQWWNENPETQGFVFIPTSGTTAKDLKETKIVVLRKKAILGSATSVGFYFGFSAADRVAVTLPHFHIGGLSQLARAEVWKQTAVPFISKWTAVGFFEFLETEKITHTSLVPTQLFDLVAAGLKAPKKLECLFIGGGHLGDELAKEADKLGWNPIMTYGSTETSSMVAFKRHNIYHSLPHAQLRISADGYLEISSQSLFEGYWNGSTITSFKTDGWFKTEDRAQVQEPGYLILGRDSDFAKINGEGVYLGRLQQILQDILFLNGLSSQDAAVVFAPSERRGHEVHLFSTKSVDDMSSVVSKFNEHVLPFEKIQKLHHIEKIPFTELGKIRWQELQ